MASIKDAIEECITDQNSAFKFLILAIPVFIAISPVISSATNFAEIKANMSNITAYDPWWGLGSIFLIFGLSLITTHNVINSNNMILPTCNIFTFIFQTIKGVFCLAPLFIMYSFIPAILIKYSASFIPENFANFVNFVVTTVFEIGMFASYILYSKNYNIKEAFKLKLIYETLVETGIGIIYCLGLLGIANVLITGFIIYVFTVFNLIATPLFTYIFSFILVTNVSIFAHLLAQLGYEKLIREENKDRII